MTQEKAKEIYESLFKNAAAKAEAFDKIAEKYYFSNFGSMSKADFDVLMFSIYIEQILKTDQKNFNAYSDYTLSKQLGITQSKVSNLKVKKELVYPYADFDWKDSLAAVSEQAVYEDGKIKLYIPDKNLYLEIKNAIEENGGFIEVQLTSNLLQVKPEFFLDLILSITPEDQRDEAKENIKEKIRENSKEVDVMAMSDNQSFGRLLISQAPEIVFELIGECLPVFGGTARKTAESLYNAIKQYRSNRDK